MLALAPADAAYLTIGNERRVCPDPVLIEAASDSAAERGQVGVIHEHHDLAERVLAQNDDFVEDEKAEQYADSECHSIVRRLGTRPDEQRRLSPSTEADVLE